jgi:dihydroorotate dehydrogenase electron transfer subunit
MCARGIVRELLLVDQVDSARIECPPGSIPSPGQYVLAHAHGSSAPLATVLFPAGVSASGFTSVPPVPPEWRPGTVLHLRGPLGHGFTMPASAHRIVLAALDSPPSLLLSLLPHALQRGASIALVARAVPDDLPPQVEVQPPEALHDLCRWADYAAFDVRREDLPRLRALFQAERTSMNAEAQVLVRTPMPCGALADCGVCTVEVGAELLLACDDGPVFNFRQLMGWASRA